MIVDVHTHVGEYPLHISEKFAAEARAAWPEVTLGGSLDDHYTDALADVDRAVVLAFNAPAAGFVVPNDYVAAYVARDPARLIGFGAVDPSAPSAIDELERMQSDLGLVGCKLGPIYQNVDPLGPDFLRVCEALERLELPMLIHQGTTFARAGSLLLARPILLDEIALRYPKLKIVIAHIGHPWFDEAIAVVRRHPHVYADISGLVTRRWLLYQALVSAIEYRVEHKLLFGTDYPFFSARQTIDGLRSVTGNGLRARHAGRRRAGGGGHHPPAHPRAPGDRAVTSGLSVLGGERRHDLRGPGDLGVADQAVGDEPDAARVALQAQDAALGEQPEELVRVELRAADVDEHDVRLDLGRLDLEPRNSPGAAPRARARAGGRRRAARRACRARRAPLRPRCPPCARSPRRAGAACGARARSPACGPRGSSPSARRGPCSG